MECEVKRTYHINDAFVGRFAVVEPRDICGRDAAREVGVHAVLERGRQRRDHGVADRCQRLQLSWGEAVDPRRRPFQQRRMTHYCPLLLHRLVAINRSSSSSSSSGLHGSLGASIHSRTLPYCHRVCVILFSWKSMRLSFHKFWLTTTLPLH
jgi:hypothetical protein